MNIGVTTATRRSGAETLLSKKWPDDTVRLAWLGQAGFALRFGHTRLLIDPYLSGHLTGKYKGTPTPHDRLMPPPILPENVRGVDLVLCSHKHSDHIDPGSLPAIAANNPECRFVVPRTALDHAVRIGLPGQRVLAVNAGDRIPLAPEVTLRVVASAHEEIATDENGNHHFLGYVVTLGKTVVYHSGDCTPYPALTGNLTGMAIDLALLPVNGRDAERLRKGILGNFTFEEAVDLCRTVGIPAMVAHHFGMFALNTVDEPDLRKKAAALGKALQCVVPEIDVIYVFDKQGKRLAQEKT